MTGYPVEIGIKTEVIDLVDPDNHCISIDFPLELHEANGGLLGTDLPMICGGDIGDDVPDVDQCYVLRDKHFKPIFKLNEPSSETGAGSVVYNNSLVFVKGWWSSEKAQSKRFQAVSPEGVQEDLPDTLFGANCIFNNQIFVKFYYKYFKLSDPCTVKLDEKTILTTGGLTGSGGGYTDKTSIFDIESQEWTAGPNMNQIRRAHGCATFEIQGKVFAIVGGGYNDDIYLNSVEFLDVEERSQWIEGI